MSRSLHEIFIDGRPADKVLQYQLKNNRKWGSQDRKLFAEGVYDIVRWWRRLLFACDISSDHPAAIPFAIEAWCELENVELGRAIDRRLQRKIRDVYESRMPRAVRESIPDWMDQWGYEEHGARWEELLSTLNTTAPVYLRANRLKTTASELVAKLAEEKIEAERCSEDGLRLPKRANVFMSKSFHAGLFEVQDLNSQRVAPALGAMAGERVIDACAGAGGKSLHLAALMKNKGKIVAMDVTEKKLEQLRLRGRRAGASSIETRLIEGTKTIKRLADSADRLLLDVPCSGMGILRRNPDAKWKLTRESIDRVRALQREILFSYVSMLKPGGTLVYATCSIMPSENGAAVKELLSRDETRFSLEREESLWPEPNGPDGFYLAVLRRS